MRLQIFGKKVYFKTQNSFQFYPYGSVNKVLIKGRVVGKCYSVNFELIKIIFCQMGLQIFGKKVYCKTQNSFQVSHKAQRIRCV